MNTEHVARAAHRIAVRKLLDALDDFDRLGSTPDDIAQAVATIVEYDADRLPVLRSLTFSIVERAIRAGLAADTMSAFGTPATHVH